MVPAYMTISKPNYKMKLNGAAVNTVMGVGCVFVVLIFLIFVISLFKYVGKIGQKETAPKAKQHQHLHQQYRLHLLRKT